MVYHELEPIYDTSSKILILGSMPSITSRKEKGWYLVCVDGYPLGFGKLANQTLKNKYLPGWRWMS